MILDLSSPPSDDLYSNVKAAFVAKKSTLGEWANNNGMSMVYVKGVLIGMYKSEKAKKVHADIVAYLEGDECEKAS